MTTIEKVNFIREDRFLDLDAWQKEFIEDIYSELNAHPDCETLTDAEVKDFLTPRQIEKINEIWKDLGL